MGQFTNELSIFRSPLKKTRYLLRSCEFGMKLLVLRKSEVCISTACVMQVTRKVSFPSKLVDALLGG